ncbi:TPA: N-acetylmuramoyl-L-alanine amidase [Streptococcus suis]
MFYWYTINHVIPKKKSKKKTVTTKQVTITLALSVIAITTLVILFNKIQPANAAVVMLNNQVINQTALVADESSVRVYTDLQSMEEQNLPANSQATILEYFTLESENESSLFATIDVNGETFYIPAANLELVQTNDINQYIAQLGYPHVNLTEDIVETFEQESYATESGDPIGVIIHDTGVEYSTIDTEVTYMIDNYDELGVFVHSFIDNDTILEIADAASKAQGAGPEGNSGYIQFEMTHVYTQDDFAMQLANAAYYTAYMLHEYQLPVTVGEEDGSGTVWTYEMVSEYLGGTDHIDPTDY